MSRYTEQELWTIYCKAAPIPGTTDRIDCDGRQISWPEHGNRNHRSGWEVDHHPIPQCDGGTDELWNLRPRNCYGNALAGGLLGLAHQYSNALSRQPNRPQDNALWGRGPNPPWRS